MSDEAPTQPPQPKQQDHEIARKVFVIRPTTTTRPAIKITVSQRVADNGEIAMATAVFSRALDVYYEKPGLIKDAAIKMAAVAEYMEELNNKNVKNGK